MLLAIEERTWRTLFAIEGMPEERTWVMIGLEDMSKEDI
jgi:hypothetical protein